MKKKQQLKKRTRKHGQAFWEAEYKDGGYLALSVNPSEDLEKFTRWLTREYGNSVLNITASVLDLGCGNGRNLVWLGETFGVHGLGYDISSEAVKQAERRTKELELSFSYEARSIAGVLPVPDESQTIVLDMMTSHFLKAADRVLLIEEIHRVLKPGGFLFYKTFLLDEDRHAKRMLKENPGEEEHTYIHPEIGVAEHVSTEAEIEELYGKYFTIHKIYKSHRHTGKFAKRRSVSIYLEKPAY
jgi:SAM-dependent methyltransferase